MRAQEEISGIALEGSARLTDGDINRLHDGVHGLSLASRYAFAAARHHTRETRVHRLTVGWRRRSRATGGDHDRGSRCDHPDAQPHRPSPPIVLDSLVELRP